MLKKESKYSFLYQAHDGSVMRPENFLNINGGRTLSSSQLRMLRINKIKNTSSKLQAPSSKLQARKSLTPTKSLI